MADQEVLAICRHLNSNSITMSPHNAWLLGCIEWFRSENQMYNFQQLQEWARNQWLLADLNDIQEASLPNTSNTDVVQLTGTYVVQINWMRDVGQSSYSQLKDLQISSKEESNETFTLEKPEKWEPKPKRMYMMEITDGVSTLQAMEYSRINKLQEPFFPGSKMLISGPVECRRNVLLLQENNVTLLGGEVASLFESNNINNVLARSLNLELESSLFPIHRPVESIPSQQNGPIRVLNNTVQTMNYRDTTPIPYDNFNENIESGSNLLAMDEDDDLLLQIHSEGLQPENHSSHYNVTTNSGCDSPVNNDISSEQISERPQPQINGSNSARGSLNQPKLNNVNNKTLLSYVSKPSSNNQQNKASGNDFSRQTSVSKRPSFSTQQSYESTSALHSPQQPTVSKITSRCTQQSKISSHLTQKPSVSNMSSHLIQKPSVSSMSSHSTQQPSVSKMTSHSTQQPSVSEVQPTITLDDEDDDMFASLDETPAFPYCKQVNGSVQSLTSKLRIRNEEWIVSAVISDGKNSFEVGFSSDVLDEIFGISAAEIQAKRAEIASNSAVREQVNMMLKNIQKKLKTMECTMTIEYISPSDTPKVIAVDL